MLAYVGGAGYVGVGEVTGEVLPLADVHVEVEGALIPATECELLPEAMRRRARATDPEEAEFATIEAVYDQFGVTEIA